MLLDFRHQVIPSNYLPEGYMFAVEGGSWSKCDEKLRVVGVWALVCHAQNVWFVVFDFEVLVFEGRSVYRFSSSSVLVFEIASLRHEAFHHAMEY